MEQTYRNCPKYIRHRRLRHASRQEARPILGQHFDARTCALRAPIGHSDTFFLGTVHPIRGANASQQSGLPAFVRVNQDGSSWWPDYPNNIFNSLGNLATPPEAAVPSSGAAQRAAQP